MHKKIKNMVGFIFIIVNLIILISNIHISERVKFDKLEADKLLKEAYKPLETFSKDLIVIEDEKLLLVPSYISCEEDFVDLFNQKMEGSTPRGFYEDLVIEKDGQLYVDASGYIPNIYTEEGQVVTSYTKKRKRLFPNIFGHEDEEDVKLVIKETWKISGQIHKRSNYFIKNESGEWILEHFNGTSHYGFVDVKNNPWNINRSEKKL